MYPILRTLMSCKSMKQKDLAKLLCITPQAVSKKMSGATDFKRSEMQKIRDHFKDIYPEVKMDDIFGENIFLTKSCENATVK